MVPSNASRSILQSGCTSELSSSLSPYLINDLLKKEADTRTIRIPDNVTYSEGALLEPLSVVLHGIRRAGLTLGRGAVICGAGPIGLIALLSSRASGAHPLVITDLEPKRLAFAKKLVPECETYQVQRDLSSEDNAKEIRKLFGDSEYGCPETVLECTGVESSIVTAAFAVRRGGTIMVIGVGRPVINNIPFMHISLAEVSIILLVSLFLRVFADEVVN
jgi:L-iditol 2-dehydrogenase